MIHLYYGDGKGKTTAACGLAIRAAGSGMRVLFTQFLKDGSSSETAALNTLGQITVQRPKVHFGWYRDLTAKQEALLKEYYRILLKEIADTADDYDMLVLDEAVTAYRYGLLDKEFFLSLLTAEKESRELVLTGRYPADELFALADYITQMKKEKHPFDSGVKARKGIEY